MPHGQCQGIVSEKREVNTTIQIQLIHNLNLNQIQYFLCLLPILMRKLKNHHPKSLKILDSRYMVFLIIDSALCDLPFDRWYIMTCRLHMLPRPVVFESRTGSIGYFLPSPAGQPTGSCQRARIPQKEFHPMSG